MKKLLILALSLLISLTCLVTICAEENVDDLSVTYSYSEDSHLYVLTASEIDLFEDLKPTVKAVDTEGIFSNGDKVSVFYESIKEENKLSNVEFADGNITFKIEKGGDYYILREPDVYPEIKINNSDINKSIFSSDAINLIYAFLKGEELLDVLNGESFEIKFDLDTTNTKPSEIYEGDGKYIKTININNLQYKVGDGEYKPISELNIPIEITVDIPSEYISDDISIDRVFYVIRIHESNIDALRADLNSETKSISFESDLYSSFSIFYSDRPTGKIDNTIKSKDDYQVVNTSVK